MDKRKELVELIEKFVAEKEEKEADIRGNTEEKPNAKGNKPVYRFQCGNVSASVFYHEYEKDGITYPTHNIAIERSYKDSEDNWKSSSTFRVKDLHKVITVAQMAYEAIELSKPQSDGQSPSSNETDG